jgi:hypothetical protein
MLWKCVECGKSHKYKLVKPLTHRRAKFCGESLLLCQKCYDKIEKLSNKLFKEVKLNERLYTNE